MNASRRKPWNTAWTVAFVAAAAAATYGCSDDGSSYYYDPYAYYYPYEYYYPADMVYADAYYVDYNYGYQPYYGPSLQLKAAPNRELPGAALRELAAGRDICPGHSTVVKDGVPPSCDDAAGASRSLHLSIELDGCELPGGGVLDGSVELSATQVPADANCDAETLVDVSYTSTTTGLSYTASNGARVVLPMLTRMGSYTRPLGGPPSTLSFSLDGSVEHYDPAGTLIASNTLTGDQTLVFLGPDAGYRIDGTLALEDQLNAATVSVSGDGVTRTSGCCYPTSGSIAVERSGADTANWTFGPDCGDVSRDGRAITLADCF